MEADLIVDSISNCTSIAKSIFNFINGCFDTEWKRYCLLLCKIVGLILDFISVGILVSSEIWAAAIWFGIAVVIDRVGIMLLFITFCDNDIWSPSHNQHYQRYVTHKLNDYRFQKYVKDKLTEVTKQEEETFKYGLASVWYGSMFNFTDFAARLWLIDETVVLGLIGITYITCAFIQGIVIFCYLINLVLFSNPSLSALYLNLFTVVLSGVGVLQHCILIGNSYSTKTFVKKKRIEAIERLKNVTSTQTFLSKPGQSSQPEQISGNNFQFSEEQITAKMMEISEERMKRYKKFNEMKQSDPELTTEDHDDCGDKFESYCQLLSCIYCIAMVVLVVLIGIEIDEYA